MPVRTLASRLDPRRVGSLLCALGVALLAFPSLVTSAIAIECLAAAFWWWARAAPAASEQVPRWAWLRRPATALWLAVAVQATIDVSHGGSLPRHGTREMLQWIQAIAVLWAGLELMAALPLARAYSDLPGPLPATGPWLPVLLPAAGFVVLWQHPSHWVGVAPVRDVAVALLVFTAVLGALRAYSRRQWTVSLRWLAIADSALAALLIAYETVPRLSVLLLWLAACGGHAFLLAGEMRGAVPRRGSFNTRLWRTAGWTALASLSWPAMVAAVTGPTGWLGTAATVSVAFTAAIASWITVGRLVVAPERRKVPRPDPALAIAQLGAVLVLALGPAALVLAWWRGFEPAWQTSLLALAVPAIGGGAAVAARGHRATPFWRIVTHVGQATPGLAHRSFRFVVGLERWMVGAGRRMAAALTSPAHDLHTGDAQEYLLFLVGLGILVLVLPLLQ